MANEFTLTVRGKYDNSGTYVTFPDSAAQQISITVAGTRYLANRQSVGTTEEALELGDLSTGGYLIGVNRDATNYMEIRSGTGATDLIRLNAGEVCCFRVSGDATAPYVIANTAAVEFEYLLLSA